MTIIDHDVRRKDSQILLGIALENAVLDVATEVSQLRECIRLLEEPHRGLVSTKMGLFGDYDVRLMVSHDESASIFVDGPYFEPSRNQSAGLYLNKQELLELLMEVVDSN